MLYYSEDLLKLKNNIYVNKYGFLKSENLFELFLNKEEMHAVMDAIDNRVGDHCPVGYYINNVHSIINAPARVGSMVGDLIYAYGRFTNIPMKKYSGVVAYIVNNLWYYDYYDESGNNLLEIAEDVSDVELFIGRVKGFFDAPMNGIELKIGRYE